MARAGSGGRKRTFAVILYVVAVIFLAAGLLAYFLAGHQLTALLGPLSAIALALSATSYS